MSVESYTTYLTPGGEMVSAPTGIKALITPIAPFDMVTPGSTSYHEAAHTVAALLTGDTPEIASRNPGPGYLGITILRRFNKLAFVAAHALGCSGAGHDLSVLHRMGHDIGSLASAARDLLSGNLNKVYAVASLIQAKGAITGGEAKWVMDKLDNPEAKVEVVGRFGKIRHFVTKLRGGAIPIPLDPAELSEEPAKTENPLNWPKHEVGLIDVPINDRPLTKTIHQVHSGPVRV